MNQLHFILGSVLVVAFIVVAILNVLRATGRTIPVARTISMAAAALLLVQYIVGFLLMGSGFRNSNLHYLIALLAIIPVGIEHGYAASRTTPHQRAITAAVASIATAILLLVTHGIGSANVGGDAVAMLLGR